MRDSCHGCTPENAVSWRMPAMLVLCAAGLALSAELAVLHYRVHTDPNYRSICAISKSFNCETVAESAYSVFLGLPLGIWGALGYLLMFGITALGAWRRKSNSARAVLFLLSGFATIVSVALAVISYGVIKAFCLFCSITYGINLVLFILAVWEIRKNRIPILTSIKVVLAWLRKLWHYPLLAAVCIALLAVFFPRYWRTSVRQGGELGSRGVTTEGLPWIGAAQPGLVVIEFTDYLCRNCRRAHAGMREFMADHRGRIQLVHREFPLDNECNPAIPKPFHVGACLLARAAYCAGKQGKFWEMNDLLFQYETLRGETWSDRAKQAALAVGLDGPEFSRCLGSPAAREAVRRDVEAGRRLGLAGTPSFLVNGKVYQGGVPENVLNGATAE